ncbi:chemotaxis protein CheB [Rhodoblastus acidophilus]|uniref:chemotaxis protein CheB n=1 Tax=Rhodoblastus acidophilus TaxID=1074 RepID=UPI0011309F08|nr:chemotaxis protein CheB [Rhodoblastus acidophilus]
MSRGALRLSEPEARRGARLPFDFLLQSLAEDYSENAVGVVLSGTGADGSRGVKAIKEKAGLVPAQDPDEAEFDGIRTSHFSPRIFLSTSPVSSATRKCSTFSPKTFCPA